MLGYYFHNQTLHLILNNKCLFFHHLLFELEMDFKGSNYKTNDLVL